MTLEVVPAVLADLHELRAAYLASLPEPQEFHCERLSRDGYPFLVRQAGDVFGYFITDGASTLIEFHATAGEASVFDRIVERAGLRGALCKSFDGTLQAACVRRATQITTRGLLYRRIVGPAFAPDPSIRDRLATERDVPAVIAVDDSFFRDAAEAASYARAGQMFVYETDDGLAGCGLLQRVAPDRDAYDVGMMVAPNRRRRGLGRHIVSHLIYLCLATGKRPIAGCNIANLASQRCLESGGFRSEHRLIEFAW